MLMTFVPTLSKTQTEAVMSQQSPDREVLFITQSSVQKCYTLSQENQVEMLKPGNLKGEAQQCHTELHEVLPDD